MSGLLGGAFSTIGKGQSLVSGLASGVSGLSHLLHGGGSGPGPGQVKLGNVTLDQHEVPDTIPWGTTMGIVEHRFPGGNVYFFLTGPQRHDITWSARMIGANAAARAKVLDELCSRGVPVTLTWASMSFNVYVASFVANYKRENWTGEYTLTCKVFPDYAKSRQAKTGATTLKGGLSGALSALSSGLSSAAQTVAGVVSEAQQAVGAVSSILRPITSALGISLPGLGALTLGLAEAQSAVGGVSALAAGGADLANATALLGSATTAAKAGVSSSGDLLALYGGADDLASTAAMAGLHASCVQTGQALGGTQADLASQDLLAQTPVVLSGAAPAARSAPVLQPTAATPTGSQQAQSFAQAADSFTTSADQTGGVPTVNVVTPLETPLHVTTESTAMLNGGTFTIVAAGAAAPSSGPVQGLPGSPSGPAVGTQTQSVRFINGVLSEVGTGF